MKKVTYEIHHLSELFSIAGHKVYAIDIPDPGLISFTNNRTVENYHRVYDTASITLFRTPIIPIKGVNRISALLTSAGLIRRIIKQYKIDVVMLYSVVTNAKAAIKVCKDMGVPVIHRTFDIPHDLIREDFLRKIVSNIEKDVYSGLARVITNTQFMKKWSVDMGAKSVDVLTQGVDPTIMKPLLPDSDLRKQLKLEDDSKIVMYLGSIESFSGLDYLIENIPTILNAIPNFRLLVVGGGSQLESLRNKAESLGIKDKVIFTGYRPYLEIPRYCSLAALCVNTFRVTEMTNKLSPVKVFDLQACAKPVLVTPLQGLKSDFPEEKSGLIYCELERFPERIIELLKDDTWLTAKGAKGKEFIQNFTWKKLSERWIDEFNQLIAKK